MESCVALFVTVVILDQIYHVAMAEPVFFFMGSQN